MNTITIETPVTEKTSSIATRLKKVVSDAQVRAQDAREKAKDALGKGSAALGEVRDFSRGNVEAVRDSGKILVAGLREFRSTSAARRSATLDSVKADFKELAATRKPTDFIKLQSEITRKNFDTAVSTTSENSEAVIKLVREAFAPISGRLTLAVEKVKAARA